MFFPQLTLRAAIILAGTRLADAHGRRRRDCPSHGTKERVSSWVVDCGADIASSLTDLVQSLPGDGIGFGGSVTTPIGNATKYAELREQYATPAVSTTPSVIVQATSETDVQAAVLFAAKCGYKVSIRSCGHSYLGVSSCDSSEGQCMQINVKSMNHIEEIDGMGGSSSKRQLRVGPGVELLQLTNAMVNAGVFVPTGECTDICVAGHMQTGGVSVWSRAFGQTFRWVHSFNIVLSDGSIHEVTTPSKGTTSRLNDDLFYAVLGGAAGSYGVVTEITFDTVEESAYHSFFWKVNFVYSATSVSSALTIPGIKNMLKTWSNKANAMKDDSRWSTHWSTVGAQTGLAARFGGFGFNYLQFDSAWVVPKSSTLTESKAFEQAKAFVDEIINACEDCMLVDDLIESAPLPDALKPLLLAAFGSTLEAKKPLSQLHRDLSLFDFESFGLDVPYVASWQQASAFPDAHGIQSIFEQISNYLPEKGERLFAISQFTTAPTEPNPDERRSLPWQKDVFGVTLDIFDLSADGLINYDDQVREFQRNTRLALNDEDHRAFWSAYDDPNLQCREDWEKYYDSEEKYRRLVDIKNCVDRHDLFENRLSIPPGGKRTGTDHSQTRRSGKPKKKKLHSETRTGMHSETRSETQKSVHSAGKQIGADAEKQTSAARSGKRSGGKHNKDCSA